MKLNSKNLVLLTSLCLLTLGASILLSGCGITSNLAGASVSVDVAQKGMVAGFTLAGGSNNVAAGVSYADRSNNIVVGTVIPTGK